MIIRSASQPLVLRFAQHRRQDTWRDMVPTQLLIIRVEREEEEKSPTQGRYGEKFQ